MVARKSRLPVERSAIEYLILADTVEVLNGKVYMMGGGWDAVTTQTIDAAVPISFTCGVSVAWGERDDEHTLRLGIEDLDGVAVETPVTASFKTGSSPMAERGSAAHVPLAVKGAFTFPRYGTYVLVAELDGQAETTRKLHFHIRGGTTNPQ